MNTKGNSTVEKPTLSFHRSLETMDAIPVEYEVGSRNKVAEA